MPPGRGHHHAGMTTPQPAANNLPVVTIKHPTNPKLNGVVQFRIPDAYTRIAIGRRCTELANFGRPAHLPRLNVNDLPYQEYQLAWKLATLEYVIVKAPEGLYSNINGQPVLTPGALLDIEGVDDDDNPQADDVEGIIDQIFTAYQTWRSSFRRSRNGNADRVDAQPISERDDANRSPNGGETPDGPGHPAGTGEPS